MKVPRLEIPTQHSRQYRHFSLYILLIVESSSVCPQWPARLAVSNVYVTSRVAGRAEVCRCFTSSRLCQAWRKTAINGTPSTPSGETTLPSLPASSAPHIAFSAM